MSLKQKTLSGLAWSFLEDLGRSGLLFVCGIVLARLLSPKEFGLIGMTTVFIALSQTFVDSGFTQALIRKQDCTQTDFSTVFVFNLLAGIFFAGVLYLCAGVIGRFFSEPSLPGILRILSLGLPLNALGQVHRTQISKDLDFKLLTRISLLSSAAAGCIAIGLAAAGYGVWSLVAMTLCRSGFEVMLFWIWRRWRPSWTFERRIFRELFSFGSPLLASSLIGSLYKHLSSLLIGRFFSAADLGQFTQAQTIRNLPSERMTEVVQRVSYPLLATLQDDVPRLRSSYRQLIRSLMLLCSSAMLALAAVAEPLVLTLVGSQWLPAAGFLRLLCFVAILYPLHAVNLNMLNVRGRSDLTLKLSLLKTSIAVPGMLAGIQYGIHAMIVALFFVSLIGYLITASWSGKLIDYPLFEQIGDIFPPFALAGAIALPVHFLGLLLPLSHFPKLLVQTAALLFVGFLLGELTRLRAYMYVRTLILEQTIRRNRSTIESGD
jgi:teichuronic acid exporter